ncbi:hypothetical protein [Prosthecodimorpha staleyi]|uniref:Uncharacterized protein n=1 Tax=Prosthecodimorpha staleyi TaxID=2840188 RepID=A0A947GDD9_9HYPH|nr:hypothetical protein [Prosthecodimorpha staleyi]MBT9290747.1 hypothetical protein [Prosthecodimorpha staleyi]
MIVERKLTAEELAEILRVPLEAARAVAIRNEWRFERDRRGRLRISVPDQFLKAQTGGARPQARRAAPSETPAPAKRKAASAPAAEPAAARPAAKARPANHRSPPAAAAPTATATAPGADPDSRPPQRRAEAGAGAGARGATEPVPPPKEAGRQDAFSLQVRVSSLESQIETLMKLALLERQRAEEAIAERNHWRNLAERLIEALPDSSSWLRRWLH